MAISPGLRGSPPRKGVAVIGERITNTPLAVVPAPSCRHWLLFGRFRGLWERLAVSVGSYPTKEVRKAPEARIWLLWGFVGEGRTNRG